MDINTKISLTSLVFVILTLFIMSLFRGENQELIPPWLQLVTLSVFAVSVIGFVVGVIMKIWQ